MSYQVIARKWRPQTFADVVGQVHITQTLGNALKSGRVHHALLFTGPRGTGKTSSARILAKALRCPNAVDFVPCGTCSSCQEISTSRSLDVQELDAASNNSVDDIRKLLDGVMSAPASGRWKIYIIDEVHMLSASAFNALLKTLEEPPAHVLFILATTEVHKIPETILSRCLRFDFRRISTRQIADHLKHICEQEGVKADEDALWLIARQGDGSMRDSLSLLDQVITFASGVLHKDSVTRILGLTDRSLLFEVLNNLLARDTHGMLKVIEKFASTGSEPRLFANELLETVRNLLVIKISGAEMTSILDLPDSEMKFFAEIGAQMIEEEMHLLFDMALKGAGDIPRAQDPRLVLEVLLLRMAAAPRLTDLQSLIGQNPSPRRGLRQIEHRETENRREVAAPAVPKVAAPVAPKPRRAEGKSPEEKWLHFVELVRAQDRIFAAKIESLLFSGEMGQILKLAIPPKMVFLKDQLNDPETRKKLKAFIDSLWGDSYSVEIVAGRETPGGTSAQALAAQRQKEADEEIKNRIAEHPLVKAAKTVFQGEIKSITSVKEGARK
ncbi:MAG: DNA polymerase III subunit gamma/tau [Bdellovibrionaceae bacterium]|nr:DNA polymerase III subunit gamma/tau [Pseudobdellovibrionaceae bacterium]